MTMPVMEPDLDATVLQNWARAIDEGPFSSLCWGERIAFDNPDNLTLLGALAAWTDRVRLVTTVIVPQLHDPVMLAKAPGDRRHAVRRPADRGPRRGRQATRTTAPSAPTRRRRRCAAWPNGVAVMKRVWAGERITESVMPVGPRAGAARRPAAVASAPSAPRPSQRRGLGRRAGRHHPRPRRRQAERAFDVARHSVGAGRQAETPPGDVVLVRLRRLPSRPAPRCIGICGAT